MRPMSSLELEEAAESRKRQRACRSGSPADLNRGSSEDRLDTPTTTPTAGSPVTKPLEAPLEPLELLPTPSRPIEVDNDTLPPLEPVVPESTFFDLNTSMPPIKRGASLMDVPHFSASLLDVPQFSASLLDVPQFSTTWSFVSQYQARRANSPREYSRADPVPAADATKFLEVIWAADA